MVLWGLILKMKTRILFLHKLNMWCLIRIEVGEMNKRNTVQQTGSLKDSADLVTS